MQKCWMNALSDVYFLLKGNGMVLSLCAVPVLSGSPFEDSKKSEVPVLSADSEVPVVSCVLEEAEVSVVREVSVVLLVSVVWLDEEDDEEEDEEDDMPF